MTNRTIATTLAAATSVVGLGFGMVATAPAAHAAPAPVQTVAVYGHTSATIRTLQQNLIKLGYLGEGLNTGYYGDATKAAVQHYEAAHKLPSTTGVSSTLYAQIAKDAAKKPSTTSVNSTTVKGLDKRCLTGARVACVDRTHGKMYFLENGKVLKSYTVRTGREGMRTRLGEFKIFYKDADAISSIYHVKMPYFQAFSGGEGIHFSEEFAEQYAYARANGLQVPKYTSHGCVGLPNKADAAWLYKTMKVGDKVVVYGNIA